MRNPIIGLAAFFVLAGAPASLVGAVQDAPERDRWLPWIGCWEGALQSGEAEDDRFLVCVDFLDDEGGVELTTYQDATPISRETMRADGVPAPIEDGGCAGERSATWSQTGYRVYLDSELRCAAGVSRTTRGVLAFLPDGDGWIEVHSVRSGERDPVIGSRTFYPASSSTLAEVGVADPTGGIELAVHTSRSQAGGDLLPEEVVELVRRTGGGATGALLVERSEVFELDARTLRILSQEGVPEEVLDVMVALAYPDRFEIDGREPDLRTPATPAMRATERAVAPWPGQARTRIGFFRGYSPWGAGFYDPFWYDPFYSSNWGSRFGYGYPGYRHPRVIVVQPPTVRDRGGRVSPSEGYRAGPEATRRATPSGGGATPSSNRSPRPSATRTPSRGTSPSPAPSASRGGSRVSPDGHSAGSSGGEQRRARPRPDEGGGG